MEAFLESHANLHREECKHTALSERGLMDEPHLAASTTKDLSNTRQSQASLLVQLDRLVGFSSC